MLRPTITPNEAQYPASISSRRTYGRLEQSTSIARGRRRRRRRARNLVGLDDQALAQCSPQSQETISSSSSSSQKRVHRSHQTDHHLLGSKNENSFHHSTISACFCARASRCTLRWQSFHSNCPAIRIFRKLIDSVHAFLHLEGNRACCSPKAQYSGCSVASGTRRATAHHSAAYPARASAATLTFAVLRVRIGIRRGPASNMTATILAKCIIVRIRQTSTPVP